MVRYADDFVVGFQYRAEAGEDAALKERLGRFNLELHEKKTRLIEFGRFAPMSRCSLCPGKEKWDRKVRNLCPTDDVYHCGRELLTGFVHLDIGGAVLAQNRGGLLDLFIGRFHTHQDASPPDLLLEIFASLFG